MTPSRKGWGAAPTAVPATDSGAGDEHLDPTEPHRRPAPFPPAASPTGRAFRVWFDPSPETATTVPGEPAPPVVTDAPLPPYVRVVRPGVGTVPRLLAIVLAGVLVALVVVWVSARLT